MGATCLTLPSPALTTFTRLDKLGLEVIGQRLEPDCAVLACRVVDPDDSAGWCRRCGREGVPHDSVTRRLVHEPFGWRPTTLVVVLGPVPVHDRGGLTYGAVTIPDLVLAVVDQTVPAASQRGDLCDALQFPTHRIRRGLSRRGVPALEKGVHGHQRVRPGVSSNSPGGFGVRSTPDAIPEPSRPGDGKVGGPQPLSMPTLLKCGHRHLVLWMA